MSRFYENDGSGRDTFINHAGAYWMNPLPAGTFFKSVGGHPKRMHDATTTTFTATGPAATAAMVFLDDASAYPGHSLFGKSRYGTTVLVAGQPGIDGNATASSSLPDHNTGDSDGFDPHATALEHLPFDVSNPEQRLWQPGHATTGLDPTGGSTFNGVADPWTAPKAVDNTLLRLAPIYESTCHYGLRTGRFYTEDMAPPHEMTLPDKGATWGKSRYV